MTKLFNNTRSMAVSFRERCDSVRGSVCRAEAIREHARRRALVCGWRQA